MASIDCYKHRLLDVFVCPGDYDIVYGSITRKIGIYQLDEDISDDETAFDGKKGDILIGCGAGVAKTLRISQKGIMFFVSNDFDNFENREELCKSFWTSNFAFKLGNGLLKLGWNLDEDIEFWFA